MGGPEAIRGYLIQTIISLIESLEKDEEWTRLELEPKNESEKVDICFHYPNKKRVIQVKSSENQINLNKIKKWCEDLKNSTEADEYELKLVGTSFTKGALNQIKSGHYIDVKLPEPETISLDRLIEISSHRLSKYVLNTGNLITPILSEKIIINLITELLLKSTTGECIPREDFRHKILKFFASNKDVFRVKISDDLLKEIEYHYFTFLIEEINENPFIGIPTDIKSASKKLNLVDYFVPIQLQKYNFSPKDNEEKPKIANKRFKINSVLRDNDKLIILSPPGSGKTTLLKRILLQCVGPEISKKIPDNLEIDYIPLYLRCRNIKVNHFNNFLENLYNLANTAEMFEFSDEFKYYINYLIFNKNIILIIDGLDEISDEQFRVRFIKYLLRFIRRISTIKVIVTSREPGFRILKDYVTDDFNFYTITDLDKDGIFNLTIKWYEIFVGIKEKHQKEARNLVEEIIKTENIFELAKNPLLLTTLLFLKRSLGIIPANKTTLYDQAIQLLIKTWNVEGFKPLNLIDIRAQLSFLSYIMTIQGKSQLFHQELMKIIQQAREQMPEVLDYSELSPSDFLERVESRTSLIILSGRDLKNGLLKEKYEFRHKTFQEYLTAFAIVNGYYPNRKSTDSIISILEPYFANDNWVEIIPMVAVLMGRDAYQLIKTLIKFIRNWEEKNRRTPLIFMNPSTKALIQSILDEAQIPKKLVKKAFTILLEYSARVYMQPEKLFLFLKCKYKDIFIELVESFFMTKENLLDFGDLLARIYRSFLSEEKDFFPSEFVKERLNSEYSLNQIKSLLLLMIFAADLKNIHQLSSSQKKELFNLGNKIVNLLLDSKEKIIYFSASWAITHFLIKGLWTPIDNYEIYQRLLNLWINEESEDIKYILSWAITSLPIIDKSLSPFIYNKRIEQLILENLEKKPYDVYKYYKLKKPFHAALIFSHYLNILEAKDIVKSIISYFKILISTTEICYESKDVIIRDFKPFIPLLKAVGESGKPLLDEIEKIKNLKKGMSFYSNLLTKEIDYFQFLSI